MEKRFVVFLVLSLTILMGYAVVRSFIVPPPEPIAQQDVLPQEEDDQAPTDAADGAAGEAAAGKDDEREGSAERDVPPADSTAADSTAAAGTERTNVGAETTETPEATPDDDPQSRPEPQWISVGSYEPESGAPLLITFNSRGASVDRVELTERTSNGRLRYLNLDDNSGYLGHLALTFADQGGCRVNVVGAATPAAKAVPAQSGIAPGLMVGDVILAVAGEPMAYPGQLEELLHGTRPGQTIELTVDRGEGAQRQRIDFTAELGVRPLQLIRPGPSFSELGQGNQPSMLMSLIGVGDRRVKPGEVELSSLDSLRRGVWEVVPQDDPEVVEFRLPIRLATADAGTGDAGTGDAGTGDAGRTLEVVKRFRLGSRADFETFAESDEPYHLDLEIELRNQTSQRQEVVYRLDGPNGLPLEGWWYSNKIHPTMFAVAGARDVIWELSPGSFHLLGASAIFKTAKKEQSDKAETVLFAEDKAQPDRALKFSGVDSQYFLAAVAPGLRPDGTAATFDRAAAYAIGDVEEIPRGAQKTTNISFYLDSAPITIEPGESFQQKFVLFTGPKIPSLLAVYGLEDAIYYGWFGAVSRLLAQVLHGFYHIVSNYGLAIIMLTVLVRSCMFPLSRKAAKNAAMMQELAPEMKKIAEKYKNDMEKRGKAQQELFKKHNYNPFSGCWMMFLQLPIFIGLYRCLSVDIELRQAALIPGIQWAANLAGPDKLFEWRNLFGLSIFTEVGMLGPYFNILPIFTIALFLVHQKLFTPPATDEQTRMQMTMMKYMTVFIGVMFFKVPAGLCLYFIASSLWGIAERKLLPRSTVQKGAAEVSKTAKKEAGRTGDARPQSSRPAANGSESSSASTRSKRRKRRPRP